MVPPELTSIPNKTLQDGGTSARQQQQHDTKCSQDADRSGTARVHLDPNNTLQDGGTSARQRETTTAAGVINQREAAAP